MANAVGVFAGQLALVTGGGTGLGLEISRGLCAAGARVVIASRNEEHHEALLAEARREGWQAEAIVLDVREPVEVERAALELGERRGPLDARDVEVGAAVPELHG